MEATHITSNPMNGKLGTIYEEDDNDNDRRLLSKISGKRDAMWVAIVNLRYLFLFMPFLCFFLF